MQRDLVVRARHGDLDAFSALTVTRTDRLFGAARLILRDPDLAEDAVQETLIRAWRSLPAPPSSATPAGSGARPDRRSRSGTIPAHASAVG